MIPGPSTIRESDVPSPDLLTVAEAAAMLRIGRTTAYELVRRDHRTGGGEGLGVVRIGGQFRIPRVALERIVGGPIPFPSNDAVSEDNVVQLSSVPIRLAADVRPATSDAVTSPTLPFTS
ncbi:MAG: helix-turn-helix domain-containing protein [Microthrixaceae bacterium]